MKTSSPILPGSRLGIIGGGQLGRMFAKAALRLGYNVQVLSMKEDAPALALADRAVICSPDDEDAIRDFGRHCAAVTVETESIPHQVLDWLADETLMAPDPLAVKIVGDRLQEKQFLVRHGFPVGQFRAVHSEDELACAHRHLGPEWILKSCRGGYDGRSQARLSKHDDPAAAWKSLGQQPCVGEQLIDLAAELSVIVVRGADANSVCCGPIRNVHRDGILHLSSYPGGFDPGIEATAHELARDIAEALNYRGVLCIEMFLSTDNELLVNELAPRPHNSGHLTLEACHTDQFEQQVRAMCGLPLGSFGQRQPAAMINLLGDLWKDGKPDWSQVLEDDHIKLHLYGKAQARPGRKMGHLTALSETTQEAIDRLNLAYQRLLTPPAGQVTA